MFWLSMLSPFVFITLVVVSKIHAAPSCQDGETKGDLGSQCKRYSRCMNGKWETLQCGSDAVYDETGKKCVRGSRCLNHQSSIDLLDNLSLLLSNHIQSRTTGAPLPLSHVQSTTKRPCTSTSEPPGSATVTRPRRVPADDGLQSLFNRLQAKISTTEKPAEQSMTTGQPATLTIPDSVREIIISDCGVSRVILDGLFKITGGSEVKIEDYPWQVAILDNDSRNLKCGGAIITKQHVLSAAHCFLKSGSNTPIAKEKYIIAAGATNISAPAAGNLYRISQMFIHPGYADTHRRHDIALVKMTKQFNMGTNIFPVCIPGPHHKDFYGGKTKICHISGWGKTVSDEVSVDILNAAKVKITSQADCEKAHYDLRKKGLYISPEMFCAGDSKHGKVDTCQGDSGGPFVCKDGVRSQLLGITSWGIGCGEKEHPGVYTKVTEHLPWLYEKLEESLKLD